MSRDIPLCSMAAAIARAGGVLCAGGRRCTDGKCEHDASNGGNGVILCRHPTTCAVDRGLQVMGFKGGPAVSPSTGVLCPRPGAAVLQPGGSPLTRPKGDTEAEL